MYNNIHLFISTHINFLIFYIKKANKEAAAPYWPMKT